MGSHGIPRGRPWASMVEYVGFRGRPPKVAWDPTGIAVQINMGSHGSPCGIKNTGKLYSRRRSWKQSFPSLLHAVVWLVMILDDLAHSFTVPMAAHGSPCSPWEPMGMGTASHGSPWHPMAAHGSPWHQPMASTHGIPWQPIGAAMASHGIPWEPMAAHLAVTWQPR